jgi:hypothetical protein
MTQAGRLLRKGVDEDLTWLAHAVREHYGFQGQADSIAKADDYVSCFGEGRMKKLSRQYLQPESANHCTTGTRMMCVMTEVGVPASDNTRIGNPAHRWNCTAQ